MKKLICSILSLALLLSFAFSLTMFLASAEQSVASNGAKQSIGLESEKNTVIPAPEISKSDFAALCREKVNENPVKSILSTEEEAELISLYMTGSDPDYYEKLMNDAGLYIYNSSMPETNTRSDGGSVSLTNAMIVYSAILETWTITCNGEWTNLSAISDEIPFILIPTVGQRKTIGGHDILAIEFCNVSGTTPHMTDSLLRVFKSNSSEADYMRGPYDFDERTGVVYGYEDYIEITNASLLGGYSWAYRGSAFSIMVKYDSSFENFHGGARGRYYHTWSTTSLSGVGFSINGISFSWTDTQHCFPKVSEVLVAF